MACSRSGFRIHWETVGDTGAEPLLVIAGMGEQIGSVEFPDEHCALFARRGFRVVRMDNRDNGLSLPDEAGDATASSLQRTLSYSQLDMADDVAAVIDAVGEASAHVVGASMGGYIARWLAVRHPDKVASLTVVMSGSGADPADSGPQIAAEVSRRVYHSNAVRRERADAIATTVEKWRWLWADHYPFEEEWVTERVTFAHDRSYRPEGVARNILAFRGAPGLWEAQTAIRCPTLVFHGDRDPIFPVEHALATAERIPAARLAIKTGMGHTMHRELWSEMVDAVTALAHGLTDTT
jgi:pimeloyl-ACP methyl ester carboxylesterase